MPGVVWCGSTTDPGKACRSPKEKSREPWNGFILREGPEPWKALQPQHPLSSHWPLLGILKWSRIFVGLYEKNFPLECKVVLIERSPTFVSSTGMHVRTGFPYKFVQALLISKLTWEIVPQMPTSPMTVASIPLILTWSRGGSFDTSKLIFCTHN